MVSSQRKRSFEMLRPTDGEEQPAETPTTAEFHRRTRTAADIGGQMTPLQRLPANCARFHSAYGMHRLCVPGAY